jgi:hypothetical protein
MRSRPVCSRFDVGSFVTAKFGQERLVRLPTGESLRLRRNYVLNRSVHVLPAGVRSCA